MNELIEAKEVNAVSIFYEGGAQAIVSEIESRARSVVLDVTTPAGQKEIASLAYKIAKTKTYLDDMGKDLTEDLRVKKAAVDKERKFIRDTLDALKEEVRRPLTELEEAEKARVAQANARIDEIAALACFDMEPDCALIESRMQAIAPLLEYEWREFKAKAEAEAERVREALTVKHAARRQWEADQAELERLRKEREARAQAEREEAIRQQARKEAEEQAARAEQERKEREARDAAQQAAREADVEHRRNVNREALADLVLVGLSEDVAKAALQAIAAGKVRHVKVAY